MAPPSAPPCRWTIFEIGSFEILDVSFAFANLLVPDFVVFTVSVENVSAGLDLGLNAFTGPSGLNSPPAVGTSDLSELVIGAPPTIALALEGEGNLFFRANAIAAPVSDVPEPGTLLTFGAGLLILAVRRFRS